VLIAVSTFLDMLVKLLVNLFIASSVLGILILSDFLSISFTTLSITFLSLLLSSSLTAAINSLTFAWLRTYSLL